MSWLGRLFGRGDELPEDDADLGEEDVGDGDARRNREQGDAYAPEREHRRLLARVRGDAQADAVRHAEDMLDRQFAITAEAEGIAEGRIARLRVEFIALDSELVKRRETREREAEAAHRRVMAVAAGLRRAGVPADEVDAGQLRNRAFAPWKVVAGLVIGAGAGFLISRDDLGTIAAVGVVLALLAVAALLILAPGEEIEDREIGARREDHAVATELMVELTSEVARIEIEREALRSETRALAENEAAFALELAAAYVSAAFSAMPAGSLEGGREFAEQREPSVVTPGWVIELETVA